MTYHVESHRPMISAAERLHIAVYTRDSSVVTMIYNRYFLSKTLFINAIGTAEQVLSGLWQLKLLYAALS